MQQYGYHIQLKRSSLNHWKYLIFLIFISNELSRHHEDCMVVNCRKIISFQKFQKWNMLEKPGIKGSLDIPAGQFFFCTPLAGIYTVRFEACHRFDRESYEISIPQQVPFVASASKFLMTASVELDHMVKQLDDFVLSVRSSTEEQMIRVFFVSHLILFSIRDGQLHQLHSLSIELLHNLMQEHFRIY